MSERLRELAARWRRFADKSGARTTEAYTAGRDDVAERYGAECVTLKTCAADLEELIGDDDPQLQIDHLRETIRRLAITTMLLKGIESRGHDGAQSELRRREAWVFSEDPEAAYQERWNLKK